MLAPSFPCALTPTLSFGRGSKRVRALRLTPTVASPLNGMTDYGQEIAV